MPSGLLYYTPETDQYLSLCCSVQHGQPAGSGSAQLLQPHRCLNNAIIAPALLLLLLCIRLVTPFKTRASTRPVGAKSCGLMWGCPRAVATGQYRC
jgi:hypothetical protein